MSKHLEYSALSCKVLAVASINEDVGDWAVYIDAVLGNSHASEYMEVYEHGSKVSQEIGEAIFPQFKHYRYRW
jgi:hypothetical protein